MRQINACISGVEHPPVGVESLVDLLGVPLGMLLGGLGLLASAASSASAFIAATLAFTLILM